MSKHVVKKSKSNVSQKKQDDFALAISYHQKGDLENAKRYYEKDIEENAKDTSYCNLGVIYFTKKDFIKAKEYYKKAIELNPNYADAYYNLGIVFREKKDLKKAQECYEKAIELNPNYDSVYNNLGNLHKDIREFEKAQKCYKKAIELNPNHTDAYNNLGVVYKELKDFKKAEECYKKAIRLNPNYANAYSNLGNIYKENKEFKKAQECYKKAIELNPNYTDAYNNLGNLYQDIKEFKKAQECYEKAIELNPNHADAHFNLSLLLLLQKNYKDGFDKYRYRYHPAKSEKNVKVINEKALPNKGVDFSNKTLLINKEQGFGDNIQFIRFLPEFIKKEATVISYIQLPLLKLFEYNYPNIKFVTEVKNITFDYNFPIMESIYFLDTIYDTIPYAQKYLSVDKKESLSIKEKYNLDTNRLKIAINHKGSKIHKNDKNRSISLQKMLEYFKDIDAQLYSLQYDITKDEEELLENYNVINLKPHIKDFYDTALFIDNMDLVISVDTSVVHLAGAMGKKTFVMLPYSPDWRWGVDGDSTNWYKSLTLFRQTKDGEWDDVLRRVKNLKFEKDYSYIDENN